MYTFLILIGVGAIFLLISFVCLLTEKHAVAWVFAIIGGYLISGPIWEMSHDTNENEPRAIDVYRGKTTLEITYRDSIPIDTVVVFK